MRTPLQNLLKITAFDPVATTAAEVVGIGKSKAELALSEAELAQVDVLVICGVGANAAKKPDVQVREHTIVTLSKR